MTGEHPSPGVSGLIAQETPTGKLKFNFLIRKISLHYTWHLSIYLSIYHQSNNLSNIYLSSSVCVCGLSQDPIREAEPLWVLWIKEFMLELNLHKCGRSLGSKGPGKGVGKSEKCLSPGLLRHWRGRTKQGLQGNLEARLACQLPEWGWKEEVESLWITAASDSYRLWDSSQAWGG